VSLVAESQASERLARHAARQRASLHSEYGFLVGRFIDQATLARATAGQWGVHPHEVMIANGWLEAEDYYRALAEQCAAPFKDRLVPADVASTAMASPRQSLTRGVLKERAPPRASCSHPIERSARDVGATLALCLLSGIAQCGKGGDLPSLRASFALHAIEGLASRIPP